MYFDIEPILNITKLLANFTAIKFWKLLKYVRMA
jgi:hypothetical protein